VSRQFVWSFLHSHPFYNSEQSSQRFVRLDEVRGLRARRLEPARATVYEAAWLGLGVVPRAAALLKRTRRASWRSCGTSAPKASEKRRKKVAREAEKKAIELARYVIPVAAFTSMVHTVSGIVLHRLLPDDAHRRHAARERPRSSRPWWTRCARSTRLLRAVGEGRCRGGRGGARFRASAAGGDAHARGSTRAWARRTSLLVDYSARRGDHRRRGARRAGRPRRRCPTTRRWSALLDPSQNRYRLETLQLSVHSPLAARCTTRATPS
jgi:hypothetical protein